MVRGTFANRGVRNKLARGQTGNLTVHHPTNQLMSFYQASLLYKQENIPLVILAQRGWGSGSSRDWAAKGLEQLGVEAVLFESCERIHRSNLVGMGILPLQFNEGETSETLGLDGTELLSIELPTLPKPRQVLQVIAYDRSGAEKVRFGVVCRIDTPREVEYYRYGGILPWALQRFVTTCKA
jgi:aconitate hydratase